MRAKARWQYLSRSAGLAWDILARGRYDFTFDLLPIHVRRMPLRKRANLMRAGLNLLYRRARPWAWPIQMKAELTNYCNLRCPVCPTGAGTLERSPKAMDMEIFGRLMDEAGPYLLRVGLYAWGEPLLHPRFADAVDIARRHGVYSAISTNGQCLSDGRVLDELMRMPPDCLTVAIDGLTDETNCKYRVGAKLERALGGVRRLAERKRGRPRARPLLHMRFLAMKHNEHELPQVASFAAENGFDRLSIGSLTVRDMDESEYWPRVPGLEGFRAYESADGARVRREDWVCQQAFLFPAVLSDGTVIACDDDFNARHPYGRLGEDGTFGDIWFGPQAAAVRKIIRTERERLSFCRNCPLADRPTGKGNVVSIDLHVESERDQWRVAAAAGMTE